MSTRRNPPRRTSQGRVSDLNPCGGRKKTRNCLRTGGTDSGGAAIQFLPHGCPGRQCQRPMMEAMHPDRMPFRDDAPQQIRAPLHHRSPSTKNVALTPCALRISKICGVVSGEGPSSNVSATNCSRVLSRVRIGIPHDQGATKTNTKYRHSSGVTNRPSACGPVSGQCHSQCAASDSRADLRPSERQQWHRPD